MPQSWIDYLAGRSTVSNSSPTQPLERVYALLDDLGGFLLTIPKM